MPALRGWVWPSLRLPMSNQSARLWLAQPGRSSPSMLQLPWAAQLRRMNKADPLSNRDSQLAVAAKVVRRTRDLVVLDHWTEEQAIPPLQALNFPHSLSLHNMVLVQGHRAPLIRYLRLALSTRRGVKGAWGWNEMEACTAWRPVLIK